MVQVIVSDIFGRTPALEKLARTLGKETRIIDPYRGRNMNFESEARAYATFMDTLGVADYGALVRGHLTSLGPRVDLIGFSVGGAAIWQIARELSADRVAKAVCFYPSQVRHRLDISPPIPFHIILPGFEPGFDVNSLGETLSAKPNVRVHKTPFLHGFMNELSKNYDPRGYGAYLNRLGTDKPW